MNKYDIIHKYTKRWVNDSPRDDNDCYGRRYMFNNIDNFEQCKKELREAGYWIKKIELLMICDKDIFKTLFD